MGVRVHAGRRGRAADMTVPPGGTMVCGSCDPAFARVQDAFEANFAEGFEIGAACTVYVEGRRVVDLWGGHTDETGAWAWQRNTIVNLMSVAKGVAALCVHRLAGQGLIDLEAPLARYWPEFAQNGKSATLVRHALDHRAGIPVVDDPLWPGAVYNWAAMISAIERQAPLFEPGTKPAYHTITMSFLTGELVRRVTGTTLGQYFHEQIATPLGVDYWLGLPAAQHTRCARFLKWDGYNANTGEADAPPDLLVKAWQQFDPAHDDGYNSARFRSAELPAVSGHGDARAIARLYAALAQGGTLDGADVIDPGALQRAVSLQWFEVEPVLTHHYRMGIGFTLNSPDVSIGVES